MAQPDKMRRDFSGSFHAIEVDRVAILRMPLADHVVTHDGEGYLLIGQGRHEIRRRGTHQDRAAHNAAFRQDLR